MLVLVISTTAYSQNKPIGYRATSQKYSFDESKTNMPMKGYYVLKNGTEVEAIIAYQKPEFLIGDFAAGASLVICKELTGTPVDVFNPDSEPNFKEYIKKDAIKGFFINGQLYGNVPNTGWRIVLTEGAIHSFISVVKMQNKSGAYYTSFEQTQKLGGSAYGSAFGKASTKNVLELMSDEPEIVSDFNAGTYNFNEAKKQYNQKYEINNPGKIDYILGVDGLTQKEGAAMANAEAQQQSDAAAQKRAEEARLKAEAEAAANKKILADAKSKADYAPKHEYYENRPATASAAVASTKPEVKVKKEKFSGRINRIKADGNKVGVVVWCKNVVVKQSEQTFSTRETVTVFGSHKPLEGSEKWADIVVEKLNKTFSTDVFEVVDPSLIPTKEVNGKKMDDWWATKYKLVIDYSFKPYYDVYLESSSDTTKTTREFKAQFKVDVYGSLGAAEDATQHKLKSAGSSPKTSSYYSTFYVGDEKTVVHTIQELKELVNSPSDADIVSELIKKNEIYLDKFIKKKSKK